MSTTIQIVIQIMSRGNDTVVANMISSMRNWYFFNHNEELVFSFSMSSCVVFFESSFVEILRVSSSVELRLHQAPHTHMRSRLAPPDPRTNTSHQNPRTSFDTPSPSSALCPPATRPVTIAGPFDVVLRSPRRTFIPLSPESLRRRINRRSPTRESEVVFRPSSPQRLARGS